jgi:hypothetical protein
MVVSMQLGFVTQQLQYQLCLSILCGCLILLIRLSESLKSGNLVFQRPETFDMAFDGFLQTYYISNI